MLMPLIVIDAGDTDLLNVNPAWVFKVAGTADGFEIPWLVVNAPAAMVLVKVAVPTVLAVVTWKAKVQVPGIEGLEVEGMVPPLRVTVLGVLLLL